VRYVVTGAAGFVGSNLAETLLAAGHEVVGVDCFTDYYDPAQKEENARGLDVRRLDLAEDELDLDGIDGVFHLAAQAGVRSFGDVFPVYVRRNLLATQRVFEAAAAAGVREVFTSSSSVYGPRQRPDMFFRRVCDALRVGGSFEIYGSGEQSRSFTEVRDAVDATIVAMERAPAGALYNVGGGDEASMLEAIALLERISGRTLDVTHVDAAKGDVRRTKADVSRIREALGWEPWTSLYDGLTRMWSWASGRVAAG
jgi:UDP-glucuronate 4-epimerase